MKKLKFLFKRIVVVYLILFLILANTSQCMARAYDAACGEYVSNYAKEFIGKYGSNSVYVATAEVSWAGGSFGNGTFRCCCTSGVKYMFEQALGVNLYNYGYSAWASNNLSITSTYWDKNPVSAAKPGDIYVKEGHVELATGGGGTANFGSSGPSCKIGNEGGRFQIAIRMKSNVDVNPSGTITGSGSSSNYDEEKDSIYGSNGFVYQGVATLSGYESGGTLGKWLFDTLLKILDWIIGLLTYILRMAIVGWTIIIERVFIDGIVNMVTGINNTSGETEEETSGDEEDPNAAIGDESNPDEYVSTGVVAVSNIGNNAKLNAASNSANSSKANVTVENIVYNRVPILDANFFNFETALTTENNEGNVFRPGTLIGNDGEGIKVVTANIDKGGIIYILKVAIATWYYTFRVMAVAVMLIVLVYLGIKSAFSSVADGKALYKEMLIGWVTGFILLFLMHYIMYATLYLNEGLVNWISSLQKNLSGQEISLYETVRSKAYEIKASTGWSGAIMYIVLVYYAVKFLFIYAKRYFTLATLAILSPVVALSYAVEKINKKGKRARIYGMWLRDFIFTTLLQTVHALIYAIFIGTALKLTEASLMGIALSLVFLHFMVHAEEIMRKIMAFPEGPSALMNTAIPTIAALKSAQVGGTSVKKIGSAYGKALNKVVLKPVSNATGKALDKVKTNIDELTGRSGEAATLTEASAKKIEEKNKKKEQTKKEVMAALGTAKDIGLGTIYGMSVIPAIVIGGFGAGGLAMQNSLNSFLSIKARNAQITGVKKPAKKKKYKFNGVALTSEASARRLMAKLDAAGISYSRRNGMIKAGNTIRERREYVDEYGEGLVEPRVSLPGRFLRLAGRLGAGAVGMAAGVPVIDAIRDTDSRMLGREDMEKREALIRVYSDAERRENEIIREYNQIRVEQDKLIAALEQKNPELADRLRRRQDSEMEEAMLALAEPITMEDVEEALAHYTERNPQFDVEARELPSDETLVGVVQELNTVLEKKHSRVRAGDNFVSVLKTNLYAAQAGIASGNAEDDTPVDRMTGGVASRRPTGRGKIDPRTGAEIFDPNDPMQSRNAPSQGGASENTTSDLQAAAGEVEREVKAAGKRINKNSSSASSSGPRYNARLAREEIDRNDPMQSRNAPQAGAARENGGSLKEVIHATAGKAGTIDVRADVDTGSLGSLIGKILELQSINDELVALGEKPIYDPEKIIKELKLTR